ncbi:hypothetical protein GCM10023238_19150 [Streptomyces heliomycini]
MEIEEVAATRPEAVAKTPIDANEGVTPAKAREIVEAAHFPAEVADKVADVLVTLWKTFVAEDALLVEVNPLAKVASGDVLALDGKVSLDENAEFRQPEHEALQDKASANPARGRGQGEEPQLRQARRRGRHHRQRRGSRHEHPRRRRLRR